MTTRELPGQTEFIGETDQPPNHVSIGGSEASTVPKFGSQQLTKTGFDFFSRRIRCNPPICQTCLKPENYEEDCQFYQRVVCASKPYCLGCEIVAWALEPYRAWLRKLKEPGERKAILVNGLSYLQSHHGASLWDGGIKLTTIVNMLIRSKLCEPMEGVSPGLMSESNISGLSPILQVLLMITDCPCPWNFPRIGPEITGYTGSSAAIEKARAWYSECLMNHKRCLQNSGSPLPTRIILIEGTDKARLHTSSAEHASYACLSHCWGGQSVIQTTARTLEQFTTNLPWEELPQTFQDAIQFAHGLGFKYLWIDSLCQYFMAI
ncbi:HET-domain-containing protein [Alternaria alternata]|nr:HET-domain-containing protein [Alternaria alternata]